MFRLAAVALVVSAAVVLAIVLTLRLMTAAPTAGAPPGKGNGGLDHTANVRTQAAAWVTKQISRSAIVACDPVMCPVLQAQGLSPQNLLALRPAAPDLLSSDIVVATDALRSRFGARLAAVYAPTVIASFGTGAARIDIRAVAPDGATAYQKALRHDVLARRAAGAQLLLNSRIRVAAAPVRQELAAGEVDGRILVMLAALAASYRLQVVAFGDAAPGASAGVPLRTVQISGTGNAGVPGTTDELKSMLSFVLAQRPPYLAASATRVKLGAHQTVLRIGFGAPSPLGLLARS